MYQRVKEYMKTHRMLTGEDKVIVGVSGGADSICLLFMLLELKKEWAFEITAVHVNHGLRGEAAKADEQYVKKICGEQHTELLVFREDVREYAKKHGLSEEEAGREVRRKCFLRVLESRKASRIALAHHRNDNAETLLWNLCRGSGLKGMGGIAPENGVWIRPLLCLNRREIESYLEKRGISYCTDETNREDAYMRNRIRNHVIPYLEEYINPKSVEHMAECMEKLRRAEAYIERETERYLRECVRMEGDEKWILDKKRLEDVPEELKSGVIQELLCRVAGKRKDIGSVHVEAVEELLERQVGKKADLPYGMEAVRTYEGIRFWQKRTHFWQSESPEGDKGAEAEELFRMQVLERGEEHQTIPQKTYTKWFDYDIINSAVKIRHREPGDYIVIDNAGNTQKIKQYFINAKIPREVRDKVWLVAEGQEILWIVGYRQSQAYQITKDTKKILEIEFYGGKRDGREDKSIDPGRRAWEENRRIGKEDQ